MFLESFTDASFRQATGHDFTLRQMNVSVSRSGTVRGIHFADVPPGQAKYVQCFSGRILDIVVDIRVGSPTFGTWVSAELNDDKKAVEEELSKQGLTGAELERTREAMLADLLRNRIDEILLRQKGKDMNLKVEADLNKQIADYQRQFKMPDPDQFQKFVVEQTGKSYEDFRGSLQDKLLVDGVIRDEIMRKVAVPTEEIRAYYDEHRNEFQRMERVFLREILVSTEDKKAQEELTAAENRAKDLATRAKRGENFPQMVQQNSDNELTKERGGLLDPFVKGSLNPAIEDLVWNQQPGFITDPIRFDNGWEIFKVEDHQREGLASYEEVEQELQNLLYSQRQGPAIRAYLTKLRGEVAFVQGLPNDGKVIEDARKYE